MGRPAQTSLSSPDGWEADLTSASPAIRTFIDTWRSTSATAAMDAATARLRAQGGTTAPPVALVPLLDLLGAKHQQVQMRASGHTGATARGWTVSTQAGKPWRRTRFTLAHEIGHLLLYQAVAGQPSLFKDLHRDAIRDAIETLCDYAGSTLLLPAQDVREQLAHHRPPEQTDHQADNQAHDHADNPAKRQLGANRSEDEPVQTHTLAVTPGPETDRAARPPLPTGPGLIALYDRYLVSGQVLARRVLELADATDLITWEHRPHREAHPEWRVSGTTRSTREDIPATQTARLFIPQHMSRGHLSPDLIGEAAETGHAYSGAATLTVGGRAATGEMVAFRPLTRTVGHRPLFEGHAVPDETSSTVHLLMRLRSAGPVSRKTKFP